MYFKFGEDKLIKKEQWIIGLSSGWYKIKSSYSFIKHWYNLQFAFASGMKAGALEW